jgi:transposase-like protein
VLKVPCGVPILKESTLDPEVNAMSDSDAFRTCPYCATEGVPKLVVYPRLVAGTATSWRCRSCDRLWSDAQLHLLRAS